MEYKIDSKHGLLIVIIDDDDYLKIKDFNWWILKSRQKYWAVYTHYENGIEKTVKMHRYLVGVEDVETRVSHIDGNTLNNTKNNLLIKPNSCVIKLQDLSGFKCNNLIVIKKHDKKHLTKAMWLCVCKCGSEILVEEWRIKTLKAQSCGCVRNEDFGKRVLKHGHSIGYSPEYRAWHHMKERCNNPKNKRYYDYGGRGISVCDRWMTSFENFLEDMGTRPSTEHSLDRFPNNDGNYEPSNCRWATRLQQMKGRRNAIIINYEGEKYSITELAIKLNLDRELVRKKYVLNKPI